MFRACGFARIATLQCDEADGLYSGFTSDSGILLRTLVTSSGRNFSLLEQFEALLASYLDNRSRDSTASPCDKAWGQPFLSASDISQGLKLGILLKGTLLVPDFDPTSATVLVQSGSDAQYSSVLIRDESARNRAFHGDTVVIRILPKSLWFRPKSDVALVSASPLDGEASDDENETYPAAVEAEQEAAVGEALSSMYPCGAVVGILHRAPSEIIATIPCRNRDGDEAEKRERVVLGPGLGRDEYVLAVPVDRRLPKIRLRTRQYDLIKGQRISLTFDDWPLGSRYPNGHFSRVIGPSSDWKTEVECILFRSNVSRRPFSAEALACLPTTACGVSWEADMDLCRVDLRSARRVFSVDPPGCCDIDDAMSCEWLGPGQMEVGVHIADVCAFLQQGSALDLEARARATSVYLPHERIDMLPSLISGEMASLLGCRDRLAVSVVWLVSVAHKHDGRPVNPQEDLLALYEAGEVSLTFPSEASWAGRSLIRSAAAMTYQQAHNLIHDLPPGPVTPPRSPVEAGQVIQMSLWGSLEKDLKNLTVVSRVLLQLRQQGKSLDLNQGGGSELKFKLDAEGLPVQATTKEDVEVHSTIAELMIAANSAVCSLIQKHMPTSTLMRIHPPPSLHKLSALKAFSESVGVAVLDGSTAEKNLETLSEFPEKVAKLAKGDANVIKLMTSMLIKAMNEAKYVSSSQLAGSLSGGQSSSGNMLLQGHCGLGLHYYTHFTSPIRRYADVIVHRQLLCLLPRPSEHLPEVYRPARGMVVEDSSSREAEHRPHEQQQLQQHQRAVIDLDEELDFLLSGPSSSPAANSQDDGFLDSLLDAPNQLASVLSSSQEAETSNEKELESRPPYSSGELTTIAAHLNNKNRGAKAAQMDCQAFFLSLYFKNKVARYTALVYSVKSNGFLVYIPAIDHKGPCFVKTKEGVLCMDPLLLQLPQQTGFPPPADFLRGPRGNQQRLLRDYDSILHDSPGGVCLTIAKRGTGEKPILTVRPMDHVLVDITSGHQAGGGSVAIANKLSISLVGFVCPVVSQQLKSEDVKSGTTVQTNKIDQIVQSVSDVASSRGDDGGGPIRADADAEIIYKSVSHLVHGALSNDDDRIGMKVGMVCAIDDAITSGDRWLEDLCSKRFWKKQQLQQQEVSIHTENESPNTSVVRKRCLQKIIKCGRRKELCGTSRLSFGNSSSVCSATGPGTSTATEDPDKDGSQLKGYANARLKMKSMGEEWAEEEELPVSWEDGGGGAGIGDPPSSVVSQLSRQAMARVNKLKVEKRNSKYG